MKDYVFKKSLETSKVTKDELISVFKRVRKRIGHTPSKSEWQKYPGVPSITTITNRFGEWRKFVMACGYKPLKTREITWL